MTSKGNEHDEGATSKVVETGNASGAVLVDPKAKTVGKDKSKAERSARKARRAARVQDDQMPKGQGDKVDEPKNDAQVGDGTEQVPEGEAEPVEEDADDQGSGNLEKVADPDELVKPVGVESESTNPRATPDGVRRGYVLRKASRKRKGRDSAEDVPERSEMWQMMKDMMTQITEIGRSVALVAHQREPVKPAVAPEVQEAVEPVEPPEKREASPQKGREFRECLLQLEGYRMAKFYGGSDPIAATQWRDRLVRNLRGTRCPKDFRMGIALHFLEGDAYNWWLTVQKRHGGGGHLL